MSSYPECWFLAFLSNDLLTASEAAGRYVFVRALTYKH